ncbi:hypothetical protein ACWD33_15890 [Streptomyces xiamenensis]
MDPQTLDLARWQFGLTAALFVTVVFGGLQLESLTTLQPMKSAVFRREAEEVARPGRTDRAFRTRRPPAERGADPGRGPAHDAGVRPADVRGAGRGGARLLPPRGVPLAALAPGADGDGAAAVPAGLPLRENAARGPVPGLLVPALTAFVPVLVAAQWWLWRALRDPGRRTPFFF